jgi:hypothetical protein
MYFYRVNQYTFPTRFHVIHKYSLNIRKETCFFVSLRFNIKIVKNHGQSGKLWTTKRILSTYNVCDLVSTTMVRKFIHSICCKMYIIQHVRISFYRNRKPFCVNPYIIIEKLFPNNGEKIVDSNVKLRKRSGLSLLLNFS